jgi:hypothetical protein
MKIEKEKWETIRDKKNKEIKDNSDRKKIINLKRNQKISEIIFIKINFTYFKINIIKKVDKQLIDKNYLNLKSIL